MKRMVLGLAALILLGGGAQASLQINYDVTTDWEVTIRFANPIGQTFTATDPTIRSVGFWVSEGNPQIGPDYTLTISLYDGVGTAGHLIASGTYTSLYDGFNGFADVDFGSVALTIGNTYTAIISDDTIRWAIRGYSKGSSDPYIDGMQITQGHLNPDFDTRFRVLTPEDFLNPPPPIHIPPSAVPEPSSITLLGLGALGLLGYGWRRKRAVATAS